jgi:Terminase small subunit
MTASNISPLKPLNDRQAEFVKAYVSCGDPYTAAISAGFAEGTAKCAGRQILELPNIALAVAREARLRLVRGIPAAIETIEWLMLNSPSHKVRLDAATRYLDRAGIVAPKAPEAQNGFDLPLHELTAAQLSALVLKFEQEIGNRANQAKDITPDPAEEPTS